MLKFKENFLYQRVNIPGIHPEPECCLSKMFNKRFFRRVRAGGAAFDFQIDAVFAHGVVGIRNLGVFNTGTGDIKDAGYDFVFFPIYPGLAVAGRNIVDFIAVFTVAVARNSVVKLTVSDIGNVKVIASQGKAETGVLRVFRHSGSFFNMLAVEVFFVSIHCLYMNCNGIFENAT